MVEMFLFKLPETARRGMDISDEIKQYLMDPEMSFEALWTQKKYFDYRIRKLALHIYSIPALSASAGKIF